MINFFAIFTIVKFRIREFLYEYNYSILAPLISNLLFVIIFSTIDRFYLLSFESITYIDYLVPGLIVMTVAKESFDNPAVSIINSKQIGSFDDFILAPLSRIEIFVAYILSQIFIGLILGSINFIILSYFISINYFSLMSFVYYLTIVVILFASIGCAVGFLAYRWDTQSTVSNFIISPINFLSGTFFSINALSENFKVILIYNPFYYIISFFRESFYIKGDIDFFLNSLIVIFVLFILFISGYIFYRGYNVIK